MFGKLTMPAELSIVVAVYNEDPRNLLHLLERLWKAISPTGMSYEVIFVNDGSGIKTTAALKQIAGEVDYVKLVMLSRNFGQQAAITAGFDHADGQVVVNIDSDLQDPPELIPQMIQKWREGFDVVYAMRSTRRDRFGKRLPAFLFYRVLGAISSVDIPWDTGDFRLLDRKVVDALKSMPERTRFLRGMIPWLGFKQVGIPIDRDAREVGESTYTIKKLLTLALDGILSFSSAPLYFVSFIGAATFGIGFLGLLLWLALAGMTKSAHLDPLFVTLALMTFAGLQILCSGVVACYLGKVLDEVRARPTYLVAERLGEPFAQTTEQTTNLPGQFQPVQRESSAPFVQ